MLWNSEKTSQTSSFPDVPWAMPVAKQHRAAKGEWYWEYSHNDLHQIDDAEQIRENLSTFYRVADDQLLIETDPDRIRLQEQLYLLFSP